MRESKINPLTMEPERRARFCRGAIIIRLTLGEAEAVEFARGRGYLPEVGSLVYRDHNASWRIRPDQAYLWDEQVEADEPHAFCACLSRDLASLFHAADFLIRDSWAV